MHPRFGGLCRIVSELRGLAPFLTARRHPDDDVVAPKPFQAWARRHAGVRLLAILNTSDKSESINLDLSHLGCTDLRAHMGSGGVSLVNGRLVASFGAYEVRIYEWLRVP